MTGTEGSRKENLYLGMGPWGALLRVKQEAQGILVCGGQRNRAQEKFKGAVVCCLPALTEGDAGVVQPVFTLL